MQDFLLDSLDFTCNAAEDWMENRRCTLVIEIKKENFIKDEEPS